MKTRYLQQEVFSKFVSSDTDAPDIRRQRAINKWLSVERDNEATNDRLILTPEEYNILPRVSYVDFMDRCRLIIESIIGCVPPEDALIGAFSGGASTSRPRTESHPANKYLGKAHATVRGLDTFCDLTAQEVSGWLIDGPLDDISTVPGNVMFTVPKKTDIDRVAAKEPDLNMFVQKGIGNVIRIFLSRIGINLRDQAKNRSLAREGSLTGALATFDLSSASDSVTRELVFQLLPVCWFTLLDSVRSPVTVIDGVEHRNHMFSSMGNGFTFELESLLFYAITKAICYFRGERGIVSVYGDDIICPSGIADLLPFVFQYLGFSVNPDKSFSTGSFRESCGGHYFNGIDITPFYVKAPLDKLTDVIHHANQLRHWAVIPGTTVLDPSVYDIWVWLRSFVPERLWGGWDTSFKYQLVTDNRKYLVERFFRLSEKSANKKHGIGGYYHWLNTTWDREKVVEAVETSSSTVGLNSFRERPSLRPTTVAPLTEHVFMTWTGTEYLIE